MASTATIGIMRFGRFFGAGAEEGGLLGSIRGSGRAIVAMVLISELWKVLHRAARVSERHARTMVLLQGIDLGRARAVEIE